MRSGKKIKAKDIAHLHTANGDHDEGRRPLAAGLTSWEGAIPIPASPRNCSTTSAPTWKPAPRCRGVSQVPHVLRQPVLQPGRSGEAAGILELLLGPAGGLHGKDGGDQIKIRSALGVPWLGHRRGLRRGDGDPLIFVIPAFKEVFSSFGADLPAHVVRDRRPGDFREWWWLILAAWRRPLLLHAGGGATRKIQIFMDRLLLRIPISATSINKSAVARWTRTSHHVCGAGVPLVEAPDPWEALLANSVYAMATERSSRKCRRAPA